MSSHREAPEISKDPVADNTDVYAFVSPDRPGNVTLIANFIPFQMPYGGPNFYEFGDDVLYEIHISNAGTAQADVSYQFRFHTKIRNPTRSSTTPARSARSPTPNWNRPQFYSVTRWTRQRPRLELGPRRPRQVLAATCVRRSTSASAAPRTTPPLHRRPRSTDLGPGRRVFAGQRADGFHVDLGSIFDLGTLRPFEAAAPDPVRQAVGVNGGQGLNVHTIAIQVPISDLTRHGTTRTT